jgi:hypothetical protein
MEPFIVLIPEPVPARFVAKPPTFILFGLVNTGESAHPDPFRQQTRWTCSREQPGPRAFTATSADRRASARVKTRPVLAQVTGVLD